MVYSFYHRDKKGVTLIEILLTLALFGIIMNLAYVIFGFGTNLFVQGESKATIQQNMRLALNYVIREVRLANEVAIIEERISVPSNPTGGDIYILINGDGLLEFRKEGGSFTFSDTLLHNTSLVLQFKRESNRLLGITVGNTRDSTVVNTEIIILNLEGGIDGSTGEALKIKVD